MSGMDPHGHAGETRDQAWARQNDNRYAMNVSRMERDAEIAGTAGGAGGGASSLWLVVWLFWMLLRAMPWLLIALAAWNWVLVSTAGAEQFRAGLRAVFPDAWVVEPGAAVGRTAPPWVGGVLVMLVLVVLVAVVLGRRVSVKAWVYGTAGRLRLYVVTFVWSLLLWGAVVVLLSLALVGGWMAAGNAVDPGLLAPVPLEQHVRTTLVLSAVAAAWAAVGSARRCSAEAVVQAQELRNREQPAPPTGKSDPFDHPRPGGQAGGMAPPPPRTATPPPPPPPASPPTVGGRP